MRATVEFCAVHAYEPSLPEERNSALEKHGDPLEKPPVIAAGDSEEQKHEKRILQGVAIRKLMRTEDIVHIDNFVRDEHAGHRLKLQRGSLGLVKA